MTTTIITHSDCLKHVTPRGHPERVARLEALNETFAGQDFAQVPRLEADLCSTEHLTLAHPVEYVESIRNRVPAHGFASIDADTHMTPGSWDAACRAVGANIQAVDMVMSGQAENVFCAVRPPGHHAEKTRAMGFCLFGTVAIGALYALENHNLERVAIVDFDVHHGNGTSDILWGEDRIMFASTHEMPLYPGTGYESETGRYGQIINKPLGARSGGVEFKQAINAIIDRLDQFKPEMIMISAGFDAHFDDPLSSLRLEPEDFGWVTETICQLAQAHSNGRIVSSLEGGYSITGLTTSVVEHLNALEGAAQ